MVIVEGCDNTGKTTLVRSLLYVKHPFKLVETVKPPGPTDWDTMKRYLDEHLRGPVNKERVRSVYDRFHLISELVYGKVLRGNVVIPQQDFVEYATLLKQADPLIIYCELPKDKIEATIGDRDQLEGVDSHIPELLDKYEKVIDAYHFNWLTRYNYTRPGDFEEVLRIVKFYLEAKADGKTRKERRRRI